MERIPVFLRQVNLVSHSCMVLFQQIALGICCLIQQGQIIAGPTVGNGSDISGQSNGSVAVAALSDGRTYRILGGYIRCIFSDLHSRFICQSIQIRIFAQGSQTRFLIIASGSGSQLVAHIVEEVVTGILDGRCHIFIAMSGNFPASGGWCDLGKSTDTVHAALKINHILQKSRCSGYNLERGTGCCLILGGKIQLWAGLVRIQLRIILRIHGIRHFVIVISRIRHHSQHISRIDIRNDYRGIAGIQCQLGRCDLQIIDPVHHKLICRQFTGIQCFFILSRDVHHLLFTQEHTDLFPGDLVI